MRKLILFNRMTRNMAARVCAQAGAGEVLVSEQALHYAGMDAVSMQRRTLELKGIGQPVPVRVLSEDLSPA